MKLRPFFRSLAATTLLVSSSGISASTIGDAGFAASPNPLGASGSGIAAMVAESVERPFFRSHVARDTEVTLDLSDIALGRIAAAGVDLALSGLEPASIPDLPAEFEGAQRPASLSPESLMAHGTSSIRVPGPDSLTIWELVPEESARFLQAAMGMMALGFVPAFLARNTKRNA